MLSNLGFALKIHLSVLKTAMVCILFQTILKVVCFLILSPEKFWPIAFIVSSLCDDKKTNGNKISFFTISSFVGSSLSSKNVIRDHFFSSIY